VDLEDARPLRRRQSYAVQADADWPPVRPEFDWPGAIFDLEIDFEKWPADEAFRDLERALVDLTPLSGLHRKRSYPLTMHLYHESRGRTGRPGKGLEFKPEREFGGFLYRHGDGRLRLDSPDAPRLGIAETRTEKGAATTIRKPQFPAQFNFLGNEIADTVIHFGSDAGGWLALQFYILMSNLTKTF